MAKKTKRTVVKKTVAKKATAKRTIARKSAIGKAVLRIRKKKISDNKKENFCVAAMFGLIALVIIAASIMLLVENQGGNIKPTANKEVVPEEQSGFEYEGWIDCQPLLTEEQAELCRQAEEAGYDKIAY